MFKCDENLIMFKRDDWVWIMPVVMEGVYKVHIEDDEYCQSNPYILGFVQSHEILGRV